MRLRRRLARASVLVVLGGGVACGRTPPPIDYGEDQCDFCRMEIEDPRYGAQLVTRTGKVHAFDAIECLASFANSLPADRIRTVLVSDFADPGRMLPAEVAVFYRDTIRPGPMGSGLLALSPGADSVAVVLNLSGPVMDWNDVRELVASGALKHIPRHGADSTHAMH